MSSALGERLRRLRRADATLPGRAAPAARGHRAGTVFLTAWSK